MLATSLKTVRADCCGGSRLNRIIGYTTISPTSVANAIHPAPVRDGVVTSTINQLPNNHKDHPNNITLPPEAPPEPAEVLEGCVIWALLI